MIPGTGSSLGETLRSVGHPLPGQQHVRQRTTSSLLWVLNLMIGALRWAVQWQGGWYSCKGPISSVKRAAVSTEDFTEPWPQSCHDRRPALGNIRLLLQADRQFLVMH